MLVISNIADVNRLQQVCADTLSGRVKQSMAASRKNLTDMDTGNDGKHREHLWWCFRDPLAYLRRVSKKAIWLLASQVQGIS